MIWLKDNKVPIGSPGQTCLQNRKKKWLDIGDQVLPVLEVEQVAYLDDGRIFEYSISRHRADRFELKSVSIH
mgnify:CR=1 FL=1